MEEEYALVREKLAARSRVGLSQEAVAERMGTTKSAISRLEAAGKHASSVTTLKKYAHAVGCHLEIRFVPEIIILFLLLTLVNMGVNISA